MERWEHTSSLEVYPFYWFNCVIHESCSYLLTSHSYLIVISKSTWKWNKKLYVSASTLAFLRRNKKFENDTMQCCTHAQHCACVKSRWGSHLSIKFSNAGQHSGISRAGRLITRDEDMEQEVQHLNTVLEYNNWTRTFISNSTARQRARGNTEHQEDEIRIVIPYTKGMSEDIRRVCRGYGIKVVFRSAPTLRNKLTVKDQLAVEKESAVVYKIPCSCGSFYIGETVRRLGTRVKEHREACIHGNTKKSAVSEHAWTYQHPHHVDQGWGPGHRQGMQTWCTSFQRGNPHPNLDGPLQQRRSSGYSRVLASITKLDGQVTAPSRLHACAMLRMRATLHCIIFKLFCFSWGRPEYWPKRRVFCFTFMLISR